MTRIVIAGREANMFWQSMNRLMQSDDKLDEQFLDSLAELSSDDNSEQFDVAIVPWSRVDDGNPWLERLGRPNCRAVIGLDGTTNEAALWTREINHDLLRKLAELFGGALAASKSDTLSDPHMLGTPSADRSRPRRVLTWAELLVRSHLTELPQGSETDSTAIPGWTAGLGQVRALLGAEAGETRTSLQDMLSDSEAQSGADDPLMISDKAGLSVLDRRILALSLAPELDGRFQIAYGYLHNDLTRGYASEAVLARLLSGIGADAVAIMEAVRSGPLAQLGLVEAEIGAESRTGPESSLRVPCELVAALVQGAIREDALGPALSMTAASGVPVQHTRATQELLQAISSEASGLIQLVGERPTGDWAAGVLEASGRRTLRVDLTQLEAESNEALNKAAGQIARIALLSDAVPLFEGARTGGGPLADLLMARTDRAMVDLKDPWAPAARRVAHILRPFAEKRPLAAVDWQETARLNGFEISTSDAEEMAATRRDDPVLAAAVCRYLAGKPAELEQLRAAARMLSAPPEGGLVRRIEPNFRWDDIVLAQDRLQSLKQIPQQVRHAAKVLHDWGYDARMPLGQGVTALFAGPSGTGKTMAARIIAADLGVELFQVDLAKTVSKYIGETEKHLNTAFADAERASAVLLFDEADALFGKRTEVKDAHDRYANVEVAYLLQRLEEFRGVVILTTNFKQNMDSAFVRRLRFIVDFPAPDAAQRLDMWKRAAPSSAPGWADLDFEFLAERFQLTGGHIQQIAVHAAFLAADDAPAAGDSDGKIEMPHVLRATRLQLLKLGMTSAGNTLPEDGCLKNMRLA
ncbi:ATP-binding protein [Ruegeria sp. MALMAid1280]|uniref:ATP-binding protein n=1 Tax=Ruegeria sp. MALMAid1280 TaxID=3411634 RepID=UPI003BA2E348